MEPSFVSSKKTVYSTISKSDETSTEHFPADDPSLTNYGSLTYKSNIAPRSLVIQRSSFNSGNASGSLGGSFIKNRFKTSFD